MESVTEVRAEIDLFDESRSGKTTGYKSGIRPNHFFEGQTSSIVGVVQFEGQDWLALGNKCFAIVRFLYPDWFPPLAPGVTWKIQEGPRHVGVGRVIEVLSGG
jgi:translation elongation factor EF-Tu-like GTPase